MVMPNVTHIENPTSFRRPNSKKITVAVRFLLFRALVRCGFLCPFIPYLTFFIPHSAFRVPHSIPSAW
ncbi:hypothetical protein CKA38_05525 [Ereboglobus luteus]|uniref:Uncharacterized protein n=1 Tax=Ereboglobus luteus TaxID=1796921 RepID=A0A2U8E1X4_9BACT|nr:hypothetical protein CKA38_05525 [Ereboglobus luteus]